MTQATDTDIRELKDLILGLDKKIDAIDKKVDIGFTEIKSDIRQVETKLEGKIDTVSARLTNLEANTKNITDLAEKLGELKNWKQIAVSMFTAGVGGVIGWFARGGTNH
jgi:ElaB/YqjD/DUF883 family membrane-anchored ribosome-binding protein